MTKMGLMPRHMESAAPAPNSLPMHMNHQKPSGMGMPSMRMTFFTSTTTPIYSEAWKPYSTLSYAATCLFLVALAVLLRLLFALKAYLECSWERRDRKRRYIVTLEKDLDPQQGAGLDKTAMSSKAFDAVLTRNGVNERVRVIEQERGAGVGFWASSPWRWSTDPWRSCLDTIMLAVGYLLMLAVMTMNAGYFLSVLGGAFLGSLLVGRYNRHATAPH